MSIYIHKSHNVSCLIYHIVCPTKYRRVVISPQVDTTITEACLNIANRYEIHFLEIGTDKDHVHFLIQSVPTLSPTELVQKIKSITARMVFVHNPEVKKLLWGGAFWSSGYFINTVGRSGSETAVARYVKNQGITDYHKLHEDRPTLFDTLP